MGIYRKGANKESSSVTRVSSQGKWRGVDHGSREGNGEAGVKGMIVFGEKELPWKIGKYEIRYHHDGKHNVMASGGEFEIYGE